MEGFEKLALLGLARAKLALAKLAHGVDLGLHRRAEGLKHLADARDAVEAADFLVLQPTPRHVSESVGGRVGGWVGECVRK